MLNICYKIQKLNVKSEKICSHNKILWTAPETTCTKPGFSMCLNNSLFNYHPK